MPALDNLSVALARLGMGSTEDAAFRPVLLSVVVDLFVGRRHHAPADIELFAAMIGPLVEGTSRTTRRRLLDKLFSHPAAPPSLIARLMDDESVIEAEMFQHATLSDEQLLAAAESGPAMFAAAIAQRSAVPPGLVDVLVSRPEKPVIDALVDNDAIGFTPAQTRALVARAAGDPILAARLVPRIADPLATAPLFPLLSSRVRSLVIGRLRRQALGTREWGRPDKATAALAERLDRLVLGGEWDGFDEVLCDATTLGRRLVPLLHDGRGELLALALAAAGVGTEVAARAFILGEPAIGRSVPAVRRLTGIVDTVSAGAARRLLAAMLEHVPPERRPTPQRVTTGGRRGEALMEPLARQRDPAAAATGRRHAS